MGEYEDMEIDRLLADEHGETWWGDYDGFHEKTCNRCGVDNLRWEQARGERNQNCWVLVDIDTDEVHVCPMASPNDFKDCS